MESSKFLEYFKIIKGKFRRDLKAFIFVKSNRLSEREINIFLNILNKWEQTNKISEDWILNNCLNEKERKNWNRIKSRFCQVIKRFLLLSLIEEQESIGNVLLLDFFHNKQMNKNFSSLLKKESKDLELRIPIDQRNSISQYWLNEIKVNVGKNKRVQDKNLASMTKHLEEFYIENRLRCLCEQINRNQIINSEYDSLSFITSVEEKIDNIDSVGVKIYYHIFKMLTCEYKEHSFEKVNDLLESNQIKLSKKYLKEIYDRLLNFCIRKVNTGDTAYAKKYIYYIDKLVGIDLFLEYGQLTAMRYKNCIAMAIIANDFKWAELFLESYLVHLDISIREIVYTFNKAQIAFYEEEYDKCQDYLLRFHAFDLYYKIACDKLWLMLNYIRLKNGEYDFHNFKQKLESIKKYIRTNKKLQKEKKSKTLAFINALSKLSRNKDIDLDDLSEKITLMDYLWFQKISSKGKQF